MVMDGIVESLNKAYQEFITAAAIVLETRETHGDQKTAAMNSAIENFHQHLLLFKSTCDEAQGFVDYLKHSLGCEKFPSYSPEHVSIDSDNIQCNPIPMEADDEKTKTSY